MSAISGNHSDQHNNETDNAVIEDHSSGPRTRSSRSGTPRTPNTKINAQAIARILSQRRSPGGSSRPNTPTATFSPTFANGVVTPTDSSNTASSHNGARRVTLHLSRSKYRLMRRVAKICKFHTIEIDEGLEGTEDFNVLWGDTMIPLDRLKQFRPWQHFNHFASMYNITRKHHLSITMGKMQRGLPEHFTFVPRSWSLKTERAIFERHYDSLPVVSDDDKQVFIMKPNAGCQGRGIVLTKDPLREVENPEDFVVQEYVSRPLLIDGRKFDLRVYVLVTSMKYPSIFVFSEGLVRLCAESYEEPNSSNMDNVCKHLTNYAVNKKSTAYQAATQQGDVGSKRNFQWFNKWLDDNITDEMIGNADVGASPAQNPHRGNTAPVNPFNPYAIGGAQPTNTNNKSGTTASAKMWAAIDHIIVKTVLSAQPKVRYAYDTLFPDPKTNDGYTCFEVLGFDILIDHKLQPWLMEVNHTPSFVTATAMDLQVKGALIKEVMSVVQPSTHDRQRFARSTSTSNGRGIATVNGSSAASSSYAADSEASSPAHFTPHPITTTAITDPHYRTLHEQWEDTRIVNFRRVFPVPADHNESEDEINSSRSHSQQPAPSARRSASATAAAADSSSERAAASFAALREAKGNSIPTCNLISDINDRIAATITPQSAELRRVVYEEILTFASHAVAAKRDPARLRALAERSHAAGEVAAEEGQWEDVVDSANTVADLNDEEPPAEDTNAEADADAELNDKADETETEKKALSGNGLRQQRK